MLQISPAANVNHPEQSCGKLLQFIQNKLTSHQIVMSQKTVIVIRNAVKTFPAV